MLVEFPKSLNKLHFSPPRRLRRLVGGGCPWGRSAPKPPILRRDIVNFLKYKVELIAFPKNYRISTTSPVTIFWVPSLNSTIAFTTNTAGSIGLPLWRPSQP